MELLRQCLYYVMLLHLLCFVFLYMCCDFPLLFVFAFCAVCVTNHLAVDAAGQYRIMELLLHLYLLILLLLLLLLLLLTG